MNVTFLFGGSVGSGCLVVVVGGGGCVVVGGECGVVAAPATVAVSVVGCVVRSVFDDCC